VAPGNTAVKEINDFAAPNSLAAADATIPTPSDRLELQNRFRASGR
jgi:hypothetical protein